MRPKLVCHMMSSIDGRLIVDRWTPPASGISEEALMEHYNAVAERLESDGWVVGRKTMAQVLDNKVTPFTKPNIQDNLRTTYVADRRGRDVAVALDPHGKLHYGQDHAFGDHIIAVLSEQVTDDYLAELRQAGVSYLFAGLDGRDLGQALDILGESFGVKKLLLEGGGEINGSFLKAGLIDEISLLVYPSIDGLAGIPSIYEYLGRENEKPAAGQSLRHITTETLPGGVVWIHYKVEPNTA